MAIFIIDTGLNENQTNMVQDIFKYILLFILFHLLSSTSGIKDIGLFGDKIFNEHFITFLLLLAVTLMAYYLVILELIEII